MPKIITINLIDSILDKAKTQKQKDYAELHAHGLVQWLLSFYFPSKIRKMKAAVAVVVGDDSGGGVVGGPKQRRIQVTSPIRGHIQIEILSKKDEDVKIHKDGECTMKRPLQEEGEEEGGEDWQKLIHTALKKIVVEDLGDLNATELLSSIPKQDPEGRGLEDLFSMESKLNVKVVFDTNTNNIDVNTKNEDNEATMTIEKRNHDNDDKKNIGGTNHVLMVGDVKKIEKKVFAIRNMISHYHWRLSGKEVVGVS